MNPRLWRERLPSCPSPALPCPFTAPRRPLTVINATPIQQRKLILRRQHVQPRTLHLRSAGGQDDEDVGVCGEAGDDEIEARGFDCEFEELVGGRGGGCEGPVEGRVSR